MRRILSRFYCSSFPSSSIFSSAISTVRLVAFWTLGRSGLHLLPQFRGGKVFLLIGIYPIHRRALGLSNQHLYVPESSLLTFLPVALWRRQLSCLISFVGCCANRGTSNFLLQLETQRCFYRQGLLLAIYYSLG